MPTYVVEPAVPGGLKRNDSVGQVEPAVPDGLNLPGRQVPTVLATNSRVIPVTMPKASLRVSRTTL
jgi:hypothetical protein